MTRAEPTLCDYCDRPAAYAVCLERACEKHASANLKEIAAMEIRRSVVGVEDYARRDDSVPPEFIPTVGAIRFKAALEAIIRDSERAELANVEHLRGIAIGALKGYS